MPYEKPEIIDFGSIAEHTFVIEQGKSFGFTDGFLEQEDVVVSPGA